MVRRRPGAGAWRRLRPALVALAFGVLAWALATAAGRGPGSKEDASAPRADVAPGAGVAAQGGEGVVDPGDEARSGDGLATGGDAAPTLDPSGVAAGGWSDVRRERGAPEQVATRLLRSYRDGQACVLARSGYLDLTGSAWGCVVQGDGWTDVCVVCATEEADVSEVWVLRLDADEVAAALADTSPARGVTPVDRKRGEEP